MAAFEVATSADGSTWVGHDEVASGGVADVTFGSTSTADEYIKQTYDHLLLKYSVRREASGTDDAYHLTLNNDTGSNYSFTTLRVISDAPNSWRASGQTNFYAANWTGAGSAADTFGVGEIWIPHYSNTANFKQFLVSNAAENASASGYRLSLNAGLWSSTAAVTSITMLDDSGDIAESSTFTLYGVTGA